MPNRSSAVTIPDPDECVKSFPSGCSLTSPPLLHNRADSLILEGLEDPVVQNPPEDRSVSDPVSQQNLEPGAERFGRDPVDRSGVAH